jgi:hypothetical protein
MKDRSTARPRRWAALAVLGLLAAAPLPAAHALDGDVDQNGVVDERDAAAVLESLVGTRTLSDAARAAADVNGDGKVDAADALIIRRRIASAEGH